MNPFLPPSDRANYTCAAVGSGITGKEKLLLFFHKETAITQVLSGDSVSCSRIFEKKT